MLEQARLEGQRGALRPAGHHGSEQLVDVRTIIDAGVAAAWGDPDPTLDDRLDRYLESSFEPDRSRDWMLEG